MQTSPENNALLNAKLNAAIAPAITVVKLSGATENVSFAVANEFSVDINLAVPYEAISSVLQTFLRGKQLQITEGFLNQHVVLEGCKIYSAGQNKVVAEVPFSGSYGGTFYLMGTPFYNAPAQHIELQNVSYDLKTNSLILKGAKWLFGKLILEEIKKYTAVNVTAFYTAATARVSPFLNKEWAKGIQGKGSLKTITITSIIAQKNELLVQARCSGDLSLTISELQLGF